MRTATAASAGTHDGRTSSPSTRRSRRAVPQRPQDRVSMRGSRGPVGLDRRPSRRRRWRTRRPGRRRRRGREGHRRGVERPGEPVGEQPVQGYARRPGEQDRQDVGRRVVRPPGPGWKARGSSPRRARKVASSDPGGTGPGWTPASPMARLSGVSSKRMPRPLVIVSRSWTVTGRIERLGVVERARCVAEDAHAVELGDPAADRVVERDDALRRQAAASSAADRLGQRGEPVGRRGLDCADRRRGR